MPAVSILVPIYKVPEKQLRDCIESCINQTLKDIEIVLVDDGSPDNCGEICDQYAFNDKRIKVIHKTNGGLSAARNTAFFSASGEYITFLDGDDFLENNACELAFKSAKENNVDVVFWDQYVEFPNKTEMPSPFGNSSCLYRGEECKNLQLKVLDFEGKIATAYCKLIKTDFLAKYNIIHVNELRQGAEGLVFNISLFEHVKSAYYLNKPLLHYVHSVNSISHSSTEENNYLVLKCFEYIMDFINNSDNKDVLREALYTRMLYVICTTAISGYFNPDSSLTKKEKIKGFQKYMQEPLVAYSFKHAKRSTLDQKRKVLLLCIKLRQYCIISLLAKMRRRQMMNQ